jgi:hypothetical protein
MKNMKLITEAWKKFVNEGNGGYGGYGGEEEEDIYPYPEKTPEEEEEDRKALNKSTGDAIKAAYAAFQNSSSADAHKDGGWIYSLRELGEIIHKVRGYSSLHHGTRPFDDIINKHLEAIGPDTDKKAYLEDKIKKDSAILEIVNGALKALGQPEIETKGVTESNIPGMPGWSPGDPKSDDAKMRVLLQKQADGTLTDPESRELELIQTRKKLGSQTSTL